MKKTALLVLALISAASAQATVYECRDGAGRKVYSQNPGKNCKSLDLGKPSVYTAAPAPTKQTAAVEAPAAKPAPDNSAAKAELAAAQKALAEGKNIRYGNERNYAKYLERIRGLEAQVKAAQEKVNAAAAGKDAH
ncbi:DUF4124 domain-containing protein [Neisseria chenwenguii]|uniref:Lipoic acid synthetase n=1 Tax=Neisseria chenwenguii TaxID=1853278 RepID=A0A220S4J7_9NEIS|nr:DUF4124 domain-containing protein [Neisseria chenwenguii]ASK28268.1 lipoic acid synthetase [Neisseria chenwenguii]ROV57393.1 DUF4124 domain-containing protein [Neisseria chenwenguii]